MKRVFVIILLITSMSIAAFAQTAMVDGENPPEVPNFVDKNIVTTNRIEIYPNPAEDFLTITIENSTLEDVEFEMYSIIGNSLDIKYEKINNSNYKIDVKEINPGYYFIVVKDDMKRFNRSFKFQKK